MSDAYWRYNDGRQQQPAASSLVAKRPRTDYDAQSGRDMASYYPRDDERLTQRTIRDTESINQSYDRYLRSGQLYPGADAGRLPGSGVSNHAVDDPRMGSDPRIPGDPRMVNDPRMINDPRMSNDPRMTSVGIMDPGMSGKGRGSHLGSGRSEVSLPPDASSTLFVEGLPANCTRREVAHIFRPFVGYKEVRLGTKEARHSGGDPLVLCFVDFLSPAHAATAMDALQEAKMSEAYWRYNDGRQQHPAVSAFVGKFPRTDNDVQSGRDTASYYPHDVERLTHCTIRGIESINQSYDSHLRSGQLYTGAGTVRLPCSGLSNHPVDNPRMGTDPRISGAPHIMSSSNNNNSAFNLRPVLEKNKLNGENFLDWERNLRIVLRSEGKESVLDTPIPEASSRQSEMAHRQTVLDNSVQVTCLMLACMEPDLQKRFDGLDAYNIIQQLKTMFQRHVRLERFEVNCKILDCRLEKGKPVGPHVFNMIRHFQHMEKLGFPYPKELSTDIIINSLHDGFKSFSLNFYMQGVEATLQELHGMLIQAEKDIPQEPVKETKDVLMVQKTKSFKKSGSFGKKKQGKNKQVVEAKPFEKPQATPKQKVAAEHECFYCHIVGHWKRNCPKYLEDKKKGVSTSGTKSK